jgi:hypothetical protein
MKSKGIQIVHFLPGRLRLKVASLKNAPGLAQKIEQELATVPGVKRAEVKVITGSLLLEYEQAALKSPATLDGLRAAVERALPPPDAELLGTWLDKGFDRIQRGGM